MFNSTFKNPGKGLTRTAFKPKATPKPKTESLRNCAISQVQASAPKKPRSTLKPGRRSAKKTVAEQHYMDRVARMGCIVCRNLGYGDTPCELHHPRTPAGGGQRSAHTDVIGLCPLHHRLGGYGVAYHAGPEEFERRYGSETDLMAQTRRELEGE